MNENIRAMQMRDDPMFNRGVTHTVEMLAKLLSVTDWVAGDGSEDYDEDLNQTLLNIIEAKGLYSSEDGSWAALSALEPVTADKGTLIARLREAAERTNLTLYAEAADALSALKPAVPPDAGVERGLVVTHAAG